MVLLPGCKCCGGGGPCWRCYSDGTEYECVGPDDTATDGWQPVGKCYKTEEECATECVPCWKCYKRDDLPESCGDVPPDLQCCDRAQPPAVLILKLGDVIYDDTLTDDKLFVGGTVGATGCLDDFKATFNPVCNKEYRLKWNNEFQCWASPLSDLNTDISTERLPQIRVAILCEGIDVSFYEYTRQDSHGAFVPTQPDGTTLMRTLFSNKGGLVCSIFDNPSIPIEVPKYHFNASGSPVPPSSPAVWAHVFYSFFENASPGSPTAAGRAEIDIVEVAFDTSTLPDSPTIGTCCTPTGDCTDTTFQECEDKCGIWTPDATCEDNPCEPVEEYKCFDAQPDEEGWVATGDCSASEEECKEDCGPWRCYEKYEPEDIPVSPPCGVVDGIEYRRPSSIKFKSFLTAGDVISFPNPDVNINVLQAWLDSINVQCFLYYDSISRVFTYRARGGLDYYCNPVSNGSIYNQPPLTNIIGLDYPKCGFDSIVLISSINIGSACDFLSVGKQLPNGRAGLMIWGCVNGKDQQHQRLSCTNGFTIPLAEGMAEVQKLQIPSSELQFGTLQCGLNQEFRELSGHIEIEFQYETGEITGRCCLGVNQCENLTLDECKKQGGIWSYGITCEEKPCGPAKDYQCFDAQPTEEGWVATGYGHIDETSCVEECPPEDPTTPTGARTMTTTKTTGGPGTELKRLLGSFGIQSKEKGCGCRSMQKKMDKPGWAESHKKEIIDHLAAEAKKRRLPFIRLAAEKLVDLAIRRADIRK